jgi:hypothetical protein
LPLALEDNGKVIYLAFEVSYDAVELGEVGLAHCTWVRIVWVRIVLGTTGNTLVAMRVARALALGRLSKELKILRPRHVITSEQLAAMGVKTR